MDNYIELFHLAMDCLHIKYLDMEYLKFDPVLPESYSTTSENKMHANVLFMMKYVAKTDDLQFSGITPVAYRGGMF